MINGDKELVFLQAVALGDQRPGSFDGAFLEIISERKISEHLEEGQMPRGIADIVQIVVLAAGADALLRCRRARKRRFDRAGKVVLERHHAGIDEQQGRVVLRH